MGRVVQVSELLKDVSVLHEPTEDVAVVGVAYRSDVVTPGMLFVAVPGFVHDGHTFVRDAADRGAEAVVVQRPIEGLELPQYVVADTRIALAHAAHAFYNEPTCSIDLIGITGTNGKTTTTYIVDAILRASGRKTGIIGTVETRIGDLSIAAGRTTPESADLSRLFAEMRDAGVEACAMEVSSHAIDLHRTDALHFVVAAFTNLTQDHLDYHHTLEEYGSVKRRLFTEMDVEHRVIDIDDPFGYQIAASISNAVSVGRSSEALVRAEDECLTSSGASFMLRTPVGDRQVEMPLAGAFNVSNALVAAGCALAIGIGLDHIVAGLNAVPQVPGRLERVDCGQGFSVVVDYAHTPDSLAKALEALRGVTPGNLISVFGCGGDRDPEKRSLMGRASADHADISIITSDNPRSEDPVGIILQVEDGFRGTESPYEVEVDRKSAIRRGIAMAQPGDSVLIAGKGHEDYQIFADRKIHFDDREVAREALGEQC